MKEPSLEDFENVLNMARTFTRELGDQAEMLGIQHIQGGPRFPPLAYHLQEAYEHLGQAWHAVVDEMRRRKLCGDTGSRK